MLELAAQSGAGGDWFAAAVSDKKNRMVFDVALGEAGKELKTIQLKVGKGLRGGWRRRINR